MKIVAFLQNMWVAQERKKRNVERHSAISDTRERMIAYALFAGCKTGRVLKAGLGEFLCEEIVWQEANPTVSTNPKEYFPPDVHHITNVLEKHRPGIVVSFTRAGEQLIFQTVREWGIKNPPLPRWLAVAHPAARKHDSGSMRILRQLLEEALAQWNPSSP